MVLVGFFFFAVSLDSAFLGCNRWGVAWGPGAAAGIAPRFEDTIKARFKKTYIKSFETIKYKTCYNNIKLYFFFFLKKKKNSPQQKHKSLITPYNAT